MASRLTHLPHIENVQAGNNRWDPMFSSIFEVSFSVPAALTAAGIAQEDVTILTEQVTEVGGLDALQKTTAAGAQKFMGVDVSFLNPVLDNTYADITITLNLNLRNATDAYVLKLFKAWASLGYDMATGNRTLMGDYCADNVRIAEANRDGTVWREVIFQKVMLTGVTGLDSLNYTSNDARTLQITLRADYWKENLA